ncbi:MAG: hypothetical protein IJQ50_00335, partial [Clostridia bacterium]|nr:hypothetical protein [Clostridia bacterium]
MKKTISLVLVIILSLQMTVFADNSGKRIKARTALEEAAVLYQLGMLDIEMNEYKPYDYITNYNFLKMLSFIKNVDMTDCEQFARSINAISEDEGLQKFLYPNYEFAVRAIVGILGYNINAGTNKIGKDWYLSQAKSLGVLKGISYVSTESLKYEDAVKMVLNTLNASYLDISGVSLQKGSVSTSYKSSDETALYSFKRIKKITGIIDSTGFTSRYGETKLSGNSISVEGNIYRTRENADFEKYVGVKCDIFVSEPDGNVALAAIPTAEVECITLNGRDFEDYNAGTKELHFSVEGKRSIRAKLEPSAAVIVNGLGLTTFSAYDFNIGDGSIVLYDNDGNSKYDVAVVNKANYAVVKNVNEISKKIYNRLTYKNDIKTIDVEEADDNKVIITKENKAITYKEIAAGDVLEVYTNSSAKHRITRIVVGGKKITENAEKFDGEEQKIVFGGKEYDISYGYFDANKNHDSYAQTITVGNRYDFYLNEDNVVIAVADYESNTLIAGILYFTKKKYNRETGDEDYILQVFTENGKWETYRLAKKVRLDDIRDKKENIYTQIEVTDKGNGQFILLKLNTQSEITEIKTVNSGLLDDDQKIDSTGYQSLIFRNGTTPSFDTTYFFASDCKIFFIPQSNEEDDYEIISRSKFSNDEKYDVNLLWVNKFNSCKYVLVRENDKLINTKITGGATMLVSKSFIGLNEDNVAVTFLDGISGFLTKYTIKFAENAQEMKKVDDVTTYVDPYTNIKRGDFIKFVSDADGDIRYYQVLQQSADRTSYRP